MSEPVYSRAPDVVWRLGPDRVLVRRVGAHGEEAAAELIGEAALAYLALDEPGTRDGLAARIQITDIDLIDSVAIQQLVVGGWISSTESPIDRAV